MLLSRLPVSARLVGGLAALVLFGTFLLMLPPMSPGRPLPFDKALFTAVSALSVTGLTVITPAVDLTRTGQIALLALIQIGGVGYMVLAVLAFRILGRTISLTDRLALRDSLGLLDLRGIVGLTKRIFVTVLAIEAIGAAILYAHWSAKLPEAEAGFLAVFHAVSAFCNAGFNTFEGNAAAGGRIPTDAVTLVVFSCLVFLGGLGIPVLYDLVTFWVRRKLSLHSKLSLVVTTGLVFWGAFALLLSETRPGAVMYGQTPWYQFKLAVFQSVMARSGGFAGIDDFAAIDGASQLLLTTLMFIGCAPASMGGGITTGTFAVLVLAMLAYARGQSTPVLAGRAIPGEMVRKAAAVLTISLFAVLTSTWLIMMTHDMPLNKAVFEVTSAFATCGLSLGGTSQLNGFGQGVIIVMMFWGRLGALTILYLFTRTRPPQRLRYPEEKILIG
ncbi:MAG: potassium transporter TrkG [Fimbriimonadaceae bacterium]